jgi:phosphotransferase system enzyme I (PtsI)
MVVEKIHGGVPVSVGVAFGPTYLITPDALRVPRYSIDASNVAREVERLEAALAKTRMDIERVQQALVSAEKRDEATIFDSHLLILEDNEFLDSVREQIRTTAENVEYAFHSRVLESIRQLDKTEDPYLRERVKDIRDVEHRVVRALLGEREPAFGDLIDNAIVVAHDLPATITAELDRDKILGIATEVGAPHSHTAILARALEIPAVVGLGPVLAELRHGTPALLDGREGVLISDPAQKTVDRYERVRDKIARRRAELVTMAGAPSLSADGQSLTFQANLEFAREVDSALAFGCEGVGLYRTEYLFLQSGGEATEEDQYAVYRKLVDRMGGRSVTIRTIDLGGDKLLAGMEAEDNPFLGWRAIRYCLDRPEVFRAQLRAILRAGAHGPVSIMLPMVATIDEADIAIAHLEAVQRSLDDEGIECAPERALGALIETPGAALMADELAARFDFLSLGTNDLIQYTLAVDRGNRRIAHLFQPFHPAVLRLIRDVCVAGERAGVEVTVCGEMAGNSRAAVVLMGLGVTRFSMVPARIPRIKQVLSRITIDEARAAASEALAMATAASARAVIETRFADRFEPATTTAGEGS